MSPTFRKHHLNNNQKSNSSSQSASSEEKDNFLNEMKEKERNESLTLTLKPEHFRLPFTPNARSTMVLENNNNCAVYFTARTNSLEDLEIEPKEGCLRPGEKAHIIVSRPGSIYFTHRNEYLIFKIKRCSSCNAPENCRIGSNHYHARHEESIFEKRKNGNHGLPLPKRDCHSDHSDKKLLNHNESYEIICRNKISSMPDPKRDDTTSTYPKQIYHHETSQNYKSPNKTGLTRNEVSGGNSSDNATKNLEHFRCNHSLIQANKRNCKKVVSQGQCFNCCQCGHLTCYCSRYDDNDLHDRTKCSSNSKHHEIQYCTRQIDINTGSGHKQKSLKTCNDAPCCHHRTRYNYKDNVRLQEECAPKGSSQNNSHAVSNIRKRIKLDLQATDLNKKENIARKPTKNILEGHIGHHKSPVSRQRHKSINQKSTPMTVSKNIKTQNASPRIHDKRLYERICSESMIFYARILFIILLSVILILLAIVYRKELIIVAMAFFEYLGFKKARKKSSYLDMFS